VRLRSFNAVQNSTFEVDQRNCGNSIGFVPGNLTQDRWSFARSASATLGGGSQQMAGLVAVPGTNFYITSKFVRLTLTTAQATLGAGDYLSGTQFLEGPRLRELLGDVHSSQLLVRSSVSGLKFGVSLRDNPGSPTRSLTKLCTLTTANSWTLIALPNLPVWDAGGTWSVAPGTAGYTLQIGLAVGSTFMSPANDVWQSGNFFGAVGQSNFAASPVNSTFDIAFVQHEPGALCTTPIDCPFRQNLDESLPYFSKSYDYATKPGTVTTNGAFTINTNASSHPFGPVLFSKRMAKSPTVTCYSTATGAVNNIRDNNAATDRSVTGAANIGESAFGGFLISAFNASATNYYGQWTADTGW
jgi:hypothetical protein